jgi:hypothetical protein
MNSATVKLSRRAFNAWMRKQQPPMTDADVAKYLGSTQSTVYRWGRDRFPQKYLAAISKLTHGEVTANDWIANQDKPPRVIELTEAQYMRLSRGQELRIQHGSDRRITIIRRNRSTQATFDRFDHAIVTQGTQ